MPFVPYNVRPMGLSLLKARTPLVVSSVPFLLRIPLVNRLPYRTQSSMCLRLIEYRLIHLLDQSTPRCHEAEPEGDCLVWFI